MNIPFSEIAELAFCLVVIAIPLAIIVWINERLGNVLGKIVRRLFFYAKRSYSYAKKQISETISKIVLYTKRHLDRSLLLIILLILVLPHLLKITDVISTRIKEQRQEQVARARFVAEEKRQFAIKQKVEKILSDNDITTLTIEGKISENVLNYLKSQKLVVTEKVDCLRPREQHDIECSSRRFGCDSRPTSVLTNRIEACESLKNDTQYKLFTKELSKIRELSSKGNSEKDPDLVPFFYSLRNNLTIFDIVYK